MNLVQAKIVCLLNFALSPNKREHGASRIRKSQERIVAAVQSVGAQIHSFRVSDLNPVSSVTSSRHQRNVQFRFWSKIDE